MIRKLDFVGIPSQDPKRSRAFYVETLGLRPDEHGDSEFWLGDTCFSIWEPARMGFEFQPQKNAHLALNVDDVAAFAARLKAAGVTLDKDVHETPWQTREVVLRDDQGHTLYLGEPR